MIYVLTWQYYDKSGFGVKRAYNDKKRADEDLNLVIKSEDGKEWKLWELEETV